MNVVDSNKDNGRLNTAVAKLEDRLHSETEGVVERLEKDMASKTISSNKAVILQTIALIVTLVGLAIAAEKRITTIEVKTAQEIQARLEQDNAMLSAIQKLQDVTSKLSENQVRVVTILETIDKRHNLEDARRAAAAAKNGN